MAHDFTLKVLKIVQKASWVFPKPKNTGHTVSCFGLDFPNPVGLAAGLDKNAECVPAFQSMGFGFIEVGTVTPRAQAGNPKPRLFRYPKHQAIINRMGFNNFGVDYLLEQLHTLKRTCPIGINIGKNRDTSLDLAAADYLFCFQKAYEFADYVTVNLSSPNTPGLRALQQKAFLQEILSPLKEARKRLADRFGKQVPILVKIAPDLESSEIAEIVDELIALQIDGVIATNTTVSRPVSFVNEKREEGGLSGAPLKDLSTSVVRAIYQRAGERLPIIAVGGIMSASDAKAKLAAGAKLVQIYTGFIYHGPRLVKDIIALD